MGRLLDVVISGVGKWQRSGEHYCPFKDLSVCASLAHVEAKPALADTYNRIVMKSVNSWLNCHVALVVRIDRHFSPEKTGSWAFEKDP